MKIRGIIALVLALCLCLAPVSALAAEEPAVGTELGDKLEDFTFTTFDGEEYTLSKVLKEKDMVLINLWATWCGPCEMEFPNMEAAYEQYQDDVEIFALSVEPEDTDEVLADYVQEHGMTFPVGRDEAGLGDAFAITGIPTSLVIDRDGVICAMEVGSQTEEDTFPLLFDQFVGEDYEGPNILPDGFPQAPPATPDVEPTDPEALAEALLGESAVALTVSNPDYAYNWPMTVAKDGETACVATSNAGVDDSSSTLLLQFTTEEDAVFAVDYRLSTEAGYDTMTILPDKGPGKTLSGEWDWRTYACELAPGEHVVALAFVKDEMEAGGEDGAWFANARVVTGDAAEEALAAMPSYPPAGAETSITVADEDAQEIVFDDPLGVFENMDIAGCWIVPAGEAVLNVTLGPGVDPECASIIDYSTYELTPLIDCAKEKGYAYSCPVDSMETTEYPYTYISLMTDPGEPELVALLFADEQNVNTFVNGVFTNEAGKVEGGWTYADGTEPGTDELAVSSGESAADDDGMSDYTLTFLDEDGKPVAGVIANVCDESSCTPMTSGEDGVIEFTRPGYAYHIQIIKVPEGYGYDTGEESYLDEDGGETVYTLERK